MSEPTYVYDGAEVKKTGRTATKKIQMPNNKIRELTVMEITPIDEDLEWKKWVTAMELFEINT